MKEQNIHQIVYSKNVVEFVTVATGYCEIIENVTHYIPSENLGKLQKILPLLYLKAAVLPPVESVLDEEPELFVSEIDYNTLLERWLQHLGEYDSFYEVFNPEIQFSEETVRSSISENLLDVYQSLKDFTISYSVGSEEVMNDGLARCLFQFKEFWGQQLLNVLRAIHKLMVSDIDFSDMSDRNKIVPGKGNPKWLDKFWGTNEEGN